jgi:ABC-2 type transport system ATP-binding protein
MTASKGYFELRAKDSEALVQKLNESNLFKSIVSKDENIFAYLENDVDAESLNKMLAEKGIYLSHLVKKRESLESQFLDLVKN